MAAQPVHVHVDGPRLTCVVVTPHLLEKLLPGEHLARVTHEERQELEGLGLDRERVAVAEDPVTGQVDLDRAEVDDWGRSGLGCLLAPPQVRPDPGAQLAQAERLGDVVVGAEFEPDDLVELGVLRRQHHDRDARLPADDAAHLDARELGA
jgi:hypothetical protein